MINLIKQGSIITKPQFLTNEQYNHTLNIFNNNKFYGSYQPSEVYYGNRLQAYPCYQYNLSKDENQLFEQLISEMLETKIQLHTIARKIITQELLQSKCNTQYGYVHIDKDFDLAGVLSFDQTVSGGTVFFENQWDKYPDISIGSYPNRLILYNAKRPHAPSQDFSFAERKILAFMIRLI